MDKCVLYLPGIRCTGTMDKCVLYLPLLPGIQGTSTRRTGKCVLYLPLLPGVQRTSSRRTGKCVLYLQGIRRTGTMDKCVLYLPLLPGIQRTGTRPTGKCVLYLPGIRRTGSRPTGKCVLYLPGIRRTGTMSMSTSPSSQSYCRISGTLSFHMFASRWLSKGKMATPFWHGQLPSATRICQRTTNSRLLKHLTLPKLFILVGNRDLIASCR